MRRLALLLLLAAACDKRTSATAETQGPPTISVRDNVACMRQQDGCILCVASRPPADVEDRLSRICNPSKPSDCVEFCTTLTAECATPWRNGPACLAQSAEEFRRQQFWLEAADRPVAELVGRVVDAESRKIEGARVELTDGSTVLAESTTGKDGGFRIVLRTGTFLVRVSRPGHATLVESVRLAQEKTPPLRVYRLAPEQKIVGKLVDPAGAPIANGTIVAARSTTETLASSETKTAADGTFTLRGLDAHRYALRAVAFGYRAPETPRVQAPAKGVTIKVDPTHIIRGRVLGPDDKPVGQARILLVPSGASESAAVSVWITADDGSYGIDGLAPGGYLVWAQRGDRATYPPMRVTLEAEDPEPLDVDLKLDHVGSEVTGSILDEDGHPLVGAHVELTPRWPLALPLPGGADTGRDGKFAVDGLTPGRYEIAIRYGARVLPELAGPRDVQVPIEEGEEIELDEAIKVRRRVD